MHPIFFTTIWQINYSIFLNRSTLTQLIYLKLEQAEWHNIKISLPFIGLNIKYHAFFKNPPIPSTSTPVWHNPDFQLNKSPLHFNTWEQKGMTNLYDLFQDTSFKTWSRSMGSEGETFSNTYKSNQS